MLGLKARAAAAWSILRRFKELNLSSHVCAHAHGLGEWRSERLAFSSHCVGHGLELTCEARRQTPLSTVPLPALIETTV